jgi:hypothetical protein
VSKVAHQDRKEVSMMNWFKQTKEKARLDRAELINEVVRYFVYCNVSKGQIVETFLDEYEITITFEELQNK